MSQKVTDKAAEILETIKQAHNILLHLHPRPDGDSVGSALATYQVLRSMGKNVTIIKGDSVLPDALSHLPYFDQIVAKNFFEIDLSQFDLFIMQDISSPGMVSGLGEVKFPPTLKTVRIDHHATDTKFANISLVDSSYIATCELLYDLYKEWGVEITHDIAICLFVGIYTDSGGFKYANTSARTFLIAASLAELVPDFHKTVNSIQSHLTRSQLEFEMLALSNIQSLFDGAILVSAVPYSELKEHAISDEDTILNNDFNIPNQLRSVISCSVGVILIEVEPCVVKGSCRSADGTLYDVSKVAQTLGGGGHKAAAGFTLNMSLDDAKNKLYDVLKENFQEKFEAAL